MSPIQQIKNYVASSKLEKAIDTLSDLISSRGLEDYEDQLILFKGRLNDIDEEEMMQTMTPSDVKIEKNKLKAAILKMAKKIDGEVVTNGPDNDKNLEQALKNELEILNKKLIHLIEKITFLEKKKLLETNPSTQFDLAKTIEDLQEEKIQTEEAIKNLNQEQ